MPAGTAIAQVSHEGEAAPAAHGEAEMLADQVGVGAVVIRGTGRKIARQQVLHTTRTY